MRDQIVMGRNIPFTTVRKGDPDVPPEVLLVDRTAPLELNQLGVACNLIMEDQIDALVLDREEGVVPLVQCNSHKGVAVHDLDCIAA
jgi:hypothetical protein